MDGERGDHALVQYDVLTDRQRSPEAALELMGEVPQERLRGIQQRRGRHGHLVRDGGRDGGGRAAAWRGGAVDVQLREEAATDGSHELHDGRGGIHIG